MPTPKRFSKGVTNVASDKTMGNLIVPDPTSVVTYMEDFFKFDPGEWITTRVATPTAYNTAGGHVEGYEQITDATDGVLAVVTTAGDDDYCFFQYGGADYDSSSDGPRETFTMIVGNKLWFKARLKCNDVDAADFYVGLFVTDTSPVASAPSDGLWFISDDGDAYLDAHLYSSSASQLSRTAIQSVSDDTYFTVGAYWDGVNTVQIFSNDIKRAEGTGITPTTTQLAVSFGIQNGSAAASTLSLDYLCVIRER